MDSWIFNVMKDNDLENAWIHHKECFICFDMATKQSPCHCTSYVHPTCLFNYMQSSNVKACKICLAPFVIYPWYVRTYKLVFALSLYMLTLMILDCATDINQYILLVQMIIVIVAMMANVYMIRVKPPWVRKIG